MTTSDAPMHDLRTADGVRAMRADRLWLHRRREHARRVAAKFETLTKWTENELI
jgi:hypothetical protein